MREVGTGRAALMADCFPIRLNARWRVVDDPIQWILQQREGGKPRRRPDGSYRQPWRDRSFPTGRRLLKREIRRLCGEVDPDAIKLVALLPEKHPGFVAHVEKNMAQYRRENPRADRGRTRPGDLRGVPVPGRGEEDELGAAPVTEAA